MRNSLKRFAAILLAVLMLLAVLPASAWGTEQYSDPIMPGIDLASIVDPETPVRTYNFINGETIVSTQKVKNGESLVEPEITIGANERLTGWSPAVSFGTPITDITESKTVNVYAQIETVYHVFFQDADGRVVATKEGKRGETITGFDEVTQDAQSVIPLNSDEGITGWKDASGTKVTSVTLANSDVTLTAVIEKGYWVYFESNDGSYVAPHFYAVGETASAPTEKPTKQGFKFDGWYNETLTTAVNFGTISTTTTVYAKWTSIQVNYTVIHWWENANDDGYSYHESETKTGNAGDLTAATGKTYDIKGKNLLGTEVSDNVFTAQPIEQKTIKGDGSTIVNVYYTRKQYTLHFKENQNSTNDVNAIKKKWGADISKDEWPTYTVNGKTNGNWRIASSKYLAFSSTMPMNGGTLWKTNGSNELSAGYWVESLDGESYILHHTDKILGSTNTIGEEDKYAITGFTFSHLEATERFGSYYFNGAKFYYTRNSYKVIYYNGDSVENEKTYKYEADISGAGDYMPDPPAGKEGYEFVGWYADPTCTTPYVFSGKKMPAENIIVYAKWDPPVFNVTVYDEDKYTVLKRFTDVPKGDTISESDMPLDDVDIPTGGEFLGWVNMDDDKPFNFDTQITKNYSIYAKVGSTESYTIAYNANGGGGTVPSDTTEYAVNSGAVLLPKGEMTAPDDPEKAYFLGWAKRANATVPDYQPGNSMVIIASDADANNVITLYAIWGPKPATTTLTYNANYVAAGAAAAETKLHEVDGSADLLNNQTVTLRGADTFTRTGYKLIGWSDTAGENKVVYPLGAEVIIDNIGEPNILYAVWEKSTVMLTLTKHVTGVENDETEFTFNVSYQESGSDKVVSFEQFKRKNGESISFEAPIGAALTIVESGAANYTTTANYGSTNVNAADDGNGTHTITGITVNETDTEIVVTNIIKTGNLTIKKLVTGNMGDKTSSFSFSYSYGANNNVTFALSNDKTYELTYIPYGTEVTITENTYNGYTTTYTVGEAEAIESHEVKVTISKPDEEVTFTNHKEGHPDTGVLLDSLPYILILAVIVVIAVFAVIRKRHNRDDD